MLRAALVCSSLLSVSALGCSAPSAPRVPSSSGVLLPPERVVAVTLAPAECGVRVTLRVAPGYHVMSNQPSEPNFIATSVTLASDDVQFEPAIYPPAVPYRLADRAIATFRSDTEILARCVAGPRTTPRTRDDSAAVDVALRYQACTQSSCLFPVTRHFSTRIPLEPRKTAEFSAH